VVEGHAPLGPARALSRRALRAAALAAAAALGLAAAEPAAAQAVRRDSAASDSLHARPLAPITVSVTRLELPLDRVSGAVAVVNKSEISAARPTWGLDEALATVPGVYASNRYNFSLDQRISIRGFGARSSFGIRGIKVLLDGIPQTLPDGSGQLTNLELGAADRIEVLRGPSSALFGNASGGVINIRTDLSPPAGTTEELRVVAGTFDRHQLPIVGSTTDETWTKWQSTSGFTVGRGNASLTISHLSYGGERQHSAADFRNVNARYRTPVGQGLTLTALADFGDDPRADNPGALTAAELAKNPDSAVAINISKVAGKDVTQFQGGLALNGAMIGGEGSLALFGFSRDLANPQTFAWIRLRRKAYGLRWSLVRPMLVKGGLPLARLTIGLDAQHQQDDRLNTGNQAGQPDTVRQLDQLEHVTEVGPFAQFVLTLPRTTLTLGARYDWVSFSADDRLITPTNPDDSGRRLMHAPSGFIGVTRSLGSHTMAYANVGTSFETPTTTELANRPDSAGGFNTGLGPQHATSLELGARGTALGTRLGWSVAIYHAAVSGELIAYQVPTSPGRVFFQNAGHSRHDGLEIGANALLVPGVRLLVAWTQSDFRYTSYVASGHDLSGRAIPGVPAQWLHFLWQVRPAFAKGAWLEVEQTHSSSVLVDDTLNTRAAAWWKTDLRLGWDGTASGGEIHPFAGIDNVFDAHYVGSVVINAANGRYYEPAPGRNVYVGLSLRARLARE
jgi:iron complex outermembrane receptor protein